MHKQRECQAGITEYVAKIIAQKNNINLEPFLERDAAEVSITQFRHFNSPFNSKNFR